MRQPGAQHLGHFNSIDLVGQPPVRNEHFWSKSACDGVRLVASLGESDLMFAVTETDLQEPSEDEIVFYDQYSRHMLSPYAQDAAGGGRPVVTERLHKSDAPVDRVLRAPLRGRLLIYYATLEGVKQNDAIFSL